MGQSYIAVLAKDNEFVGAYFTFGSKLMEHSWWSNNLTCFITNRLYRNPKNVAWVGQYADEDDDWKNEAERKLYYESAWEGKNEKGMISPDSDTVLSVSLDDKFLVNHTKKLCLNCNDYKKLNDNRGWVIHPIPLLTAKGNGRGCGDYHERNPNFDLVGSWCTDLIEVCDEKPKGYEDVLYEFKEV